MVVHGLADYRLTLAQLSKLGASAVQFSVDLKGRALPGIVRYPPQQRLAILRSARERQRARLVHAFPEGALTSRDERNGSWTLDGSLPAVRIAALASRPEVARVWVKRIAGRSKQRPPRRLAWFCVWGVVVIQIEGQRKGVVDLEDRLVLVKGFSPADAERRLRSEWVRYARPYMNPAGKLVRWQLTSVKDVYELNDDVLSSAGTEVYSRMRTSKMKPEYRWLRDRLGRAARSVSHEGRTAVSSLAASTP